MTDKIHLVCPGCNAVNRLPGARLAERPNCGKCGNPLFNATPLELTAANFATHVDRSDIPLVVDFWAPWCGPCQSMAPLFARAAGQLEPGVRLAKLNTEAEPALGAKFNVRSIPTLILFKQGREVARQAGAMSTDDTLRWVRSFT